MTRKQYAPRACRTREARALTPCHVFPNAGQARPEAAVMAEGVALVGDELLLLSPLDPAGRVGEHVVEGPASSAVAALVGVFGEGVARPDLEHPVHPGDGSAWR